ncbi:MAG: hypothetical protein ACOX8E_02155 [Ruminococcus sp.]|jgi:hypothetical protein
MQNQNHKLMIEGNALYEIDLDCLKRKEQESAFKNKTGRNIRVQRSRPGKKTAP